MKYKLIVLLAVNLINLNCGPFQHQAVSHNAKVTPSQSETIATVRIPPPQIDKPKSENIPTRFKSVDFGNWAYPYKFSRGKQVKVALQSGKFEYNFSNEHGWFSLEGVYFHDLTNDGKLEAIVVLSHVACGGSCDGGTTLFYIYSWNSKLKFIWSYETGSLAYGCGLKSLQIEKKSLIFDLFGECSYPTRESGGTRKFYIADTTRIVFSFNGLRFVPIKRKVISVPERDVMNYRPEINIER